MRTPFHSPLKRKVRTMAGTHEGRVLVFPQLTEALTPFEDKPQARKIVDADGGNLTLMELAAGQSWHERAESSGRIVMVISAGICEGKRTEKKLAAASGADAAAR